ncbi:SixA phosphatase family protein [Xaviernesmea oryzae]|uniref:SixA phosphatase family protein n=1 Tax=Xaviernesmea oryzae TaxID=464029 RepID=UPI00147F1A08|nr:histidine phosphatase family protein [Xaviernesmea oryzae]
MSLPSAAAPAFRLFLLRHARAAPAQPGQRDRERPLDAVGKVDAANLALRLGGLGVLPKIILTSPARRCRQTVIPLQGSAEEDLPVHVVEGFYSGGAEVYIHATAAQNVDAVLLCGHNPVMEELFRSLAGQGLPPGSYDHGYPPAGLAVFEFDQPPVPGQTGRLVHWLDPHGEPPIA